VQIGFVLFPNVTQLDFTGPLQVLHRVPGATVHILAKTLDPVPSDCGLGLVPTGTFSDNPHLDVLCVPGGFGVSQAMADAETVSFVALGAREARFVTSVCTGAFVLGAAGLLNGVRATTHWAYHALLSEVGAIPTHGRVVRDGRVITGGGVTAGIDFAFALAEEIAGRDVARGIQVALEYDPSPAISFDQAKATAGGAVNAFYEKRLVAFTEELHAALAAQSEHGLS